MSLDNYRAQEAEEESEAMIEDDRQRRVALDTLVEEMIARLKRDAVTFAHTEHVSVSDARIRAGGLKNHSVALVKLLTMARDLLDDGQTDRAFALLRGDLPDEAERR